MKTRTRVYIFGLIAGLIWSVIPGILLKEFKSFGETIAVLVTGAITGLLVSIALYIPLKKFKSWIGFFLGSLFFGIIALPLGAFLFGVLISIMETALTGLPSYFNESFSPFSDGVFLAAMSTFSFYGIVFLPLAMITTFFLKIIISSSEPTTKEIPPAL
jgi:hypothetical protein